VAFEPSVGAFQLFLGQIQPDLSRHRDPLQRTVHRNLHGVHHVQVEEAIEEAHLQRTHRVRGQQAYRPGMRELQIFDDDTGLDDVALAVHQQGKLAQRPASQPLCGVLRRIRPEAAEFESSAVLVQCDQHFLCVRGEGMTVESE
jgi:hypothetical protein